MSHTRFVIYYVPPENDLAAFGATWLGWDIVTGRRVAQPDLSGLGGITERPRRYGFHATLKPRFLLIQGRSVGQRVTACEDLAAIFPLRSAMAAHSLTCSLRYLTSPGSGFLDALLRCRSFFAHSKRQLHRKMVQV